MCSKRRISNVDNAMHEVAEVCNMICCMFCCFGIGGVKCSFTSHTLAIQMRMWNFLGNCRCSDQDKEIPYEDV